MSLYTRAGVYYVKLTRADGSPLRCSTGTTEREKAQEVHDRLRVEVWEQKRLKKKPSRSFDEAALKWVQEKRGTVGEATLQEYVRIIEWFRPFMVRTNLNDITRGMLDELLTKRMPKASARTKDLRVAVIRNMLRTAEREWEWIDRVPAFRTYDKGKGRERWLSDEEITRLLSELPRHLKLAAAFTLETGLRMRNVCRLEWKCVDTDRRRAFIGKTKNGDPLTVPLSDEAVAILQQLAGEHPTHVFSYKGHPVGDFNTAAWTKALQRAGIENFRWHDLRHTWASRLRQRGVPDWALQRLGGWKSHVMVHRYAHVNVDDLDPFVSGGSTQKWTQQEKDEVGGNG